MEIFDSKREISVRSICQGLRLTVIGRQERSPLYYLNPYFSDIEWDRHGSNQTSCLKSPSDSIHNLPWRYCQVSTFNR